MDTSIRWLHLTDLHVGMHDHDWLWPGMRSKFRDDLRKIYDTAGPWDLVLFTGDLVQQGTEYEELDAIFDELWKWFAELGCQPKLLAVPGNHDLQWQDAKHPTVGQLYDWDTKEMVRSEFWNWKNTQYRQPVLDAFSAYDKWWRATPLKPEGVQHGRLPGDFSCTVVKDGFRLGIVGLNSAFLQLTEERPDGSFERHMALHPRQVDAVCGGDRGKWAESHHACFLMTHHPPEWLNPESQQLLDQEIRDNFVLHLCGHNHETDVLQELAGGVEFSPLRWLGRSLFGLEKSSRGKLDRSHGYVSGEMRITDDFRGKLQFMPRARRVQGRTWSLVPDHNVRLPDDRRTDVFDVRLQPNSTGFQTIQLDTGPSRPEEQLDALGAPPSSPTDTVADDSSGLTSPPENASSDYPSTSETQTSATPNPKVSFIAHELVQVVCELLESEEEPYRTLRTELVRRVTGETEEARINVEFFVRALCEKLNDVMSVLRMWLDSNNRIEGVEDVRRVVDAVASTGFDAEWVQELLDELEGRHLHVPIETDLYLCEVIFTALYRRPATWIHERAIDHEELLSIATPSNTPKSRAREIRRRMVETYFKDRISKHVGESDRDYKERLNKWAENDLPSVLESEREDQKPWFVLFLETVDALKNDMEIDPELWSGIVKLERSRTTGQFVCDRAKLQNRLVVIHQRLRELDDQAHKGPR